jgi:hypothetical protein
MSATAVTDSLTVAVDASPATALDALRSVDLSGPIARALRALGAGSRIVLPAAVVERAPGEALQLGMIWRIDGRDPARMIGPAGFDTFAESGHLKASWEIAVTPAGDAGAYLSIRTRVLGTDPDAHARLLDAWGAVGPLSRCLVQRAARSIRSRAEEDDRWEVAEAYDRRPVAA